MTGTHRTKPYVNKKATPAVDNRWNDKIAGFPQTSSLAPIPRLGGGNAQTINHPNAVT